MRPDHVTVENLAANIALAASLSIDQIPDLLADIERLRATLWVRLAQRISQPQPAEDRLLKIEEAAMRLGTSKDWLYRNSSRLPFTVRLSGRAIRYSAQKIDRWIAGRVGAQR